MALHNAAGGAGAGTGALEALDEAVAVAQHHDAVSGTAKQHTSFDYARRIAVGVSAAQAALNTSLRALLGHDAAAQMAFCNSLNQTTCPATQSVHAGSPGVGVSLWNPLGHAREELVVLPVGAKSVSVVDSDGKAVAAQMLDSAEAVTNYQRNVATPGASQSVAFVAKLPAVGHAHYTIAPAKNGGSAAAAEAEGATLPHSRADTTIENQFIKLTFSGTTGRLSGWTNKESGLAVAMEQNFCYYESSPGGNHSTQRSGAYIFRPESGCRPIHSLFGTKTGITAAIKGAVVQEVRQEFAPWLTQSVRLGPTDRHATFEFTVGAIPLLFDPKGKGSAAGDPPALELTGKEIVSRFTTSIKSGGELLTDSNGREMLVRHRDYRPTWKLNQTEEVAGNYFPCNVAAAIRDDTAQMTVLVDRSEGVGSIVDGSLELMVHRRLTHDDGRGVGEPLDETQRVLPYVPGSIGGKHVGPGLVIRGQHKVVVEAPAKAASVWRPLVDRIFAVPTLTFWPPGAAAAPAPGAPRSAINLGALPVSVELITLQQFGPGQILVRLAHQFGIGEDAALSQPVSVDLMQVFTAFRVKDISEVSLTANQKKADILKRRKLAMQWCVFGVCVYMCVCVCVCVFACAHRVGG